MVVMKEYNKLFLMFIMFFFGIPSTVFAVQYSKIHFFTLVGGYSCNVDSLAALNSGGSFGNSMTAEEVSAGCVFPGDAYCISESMAQGSYICGSWPDNFEGAVTGSANLVGVDLNVVSDSANAAYNTWFDGTGNPTCPTGSHLGSISSGYIKKENTGVVAGTADVSLAYYKRAVCTTDGSPAGTLAPISELFSGSGSGSGSGTSTDMTATNSLLTEIRDNTVGGGSGGTPVDLTPVTTGLSNVQGQVSDVGTKIDGLSSKLDGVYTGGDGSGKSPATIDKTTKETEFLDNAETEFTGFQTSVKGTALYNSIGTFFNGVPSGGSSVFSVNAGQFGNHTIDLAEFSSVWNVIKALVLIVCSYVAIKIIFLGRS